MDSKKRVSRPKRHGVATVEFAVCLPILVLFVLGTIEACNMIYTTQSLEIAAYESGRTALVPGATSENVVAQAALMLDSRGVNDYVIALNPTDVEAATAGQALGIQITAPANTNHFFMPWFFRHRTLTGDSIVMKEF